MIFVLFCHIITLKGCDFMTRECKKILKIIYKLYLKGNFAPSTFDIISQFPDKKQAKIALKTDEIIIELSKLEYVNALPADNTFFNIQLTYKGKHYKEFSRITFKNFLLNSVVVPIILSIIGAIITTKITLWLTPPPAPIP